MAETVNSFYKIGGSAGVGIGRAVVMGGWSFGGTITADIDQFTIASGGTTSNFGNLVSPRCRGGSCASNVRGICAGGTTTGPAVVNNIDYVVIASAGNASDFGDLIAPRYWTIGCVGRAPRGVIGHCFDASTFSTQTEWIIPQTLGNSANFGNLLYSVNRNSGCSNHMRAIWAGGHNGTSDTNYISYTEIVHGGTAADFGDLSVARREIGATASGTKAFFGGGRQDPNNYNTIDYITIASLGNATYFGDLTQIREGLCAIGSQTRGTFIGGITAVTTIDKIEYGSLGVCTDFGDLQVGGSNIQPVSDVHGGLDWQPINKMHVKVSGTWREIVRSYVKAGGIWKQSYSKSRYVYQTGIYSNTSTTTLTHSGVSFGTPDVTRKILVGITGRDDASTDLSSVTIGGVAASQIVKTRVTAGGYLSLAAFYLADVPNGSSGDVTLVRTGNIVQNGLYVWSIYGSILQTMATAYDNQGATLTVSLNAQPGDWIFGIVYHQTTTGDVTWSGLTEHPQAELHSSAASHTATALEFPRSIVATCTGSSNTSYNGAVSCVFRPVK